MPETHRGAGHQSAVRAAFVATVRSGDRTRLRQVAAAQGAGGLAARDRGISLLGIALDQQDGEMVRELLVLGADADAPLQEGDEQRAVHMAARSGDGELLEAVIDGGADVERRDGDGASALHLAARALSVEAVGLLLGARADPNATDAGAQSALLCAIEGLGPERWGGERDLHLRAQARAVTIIRLLAAAGADLERCAANGESALTRAVRMGLNEPVEVLLALGASPVRRDTGGVSPAEAAATAGNPQIRWRIAEAVRRVAGGAGVSGPQP